MSINAKQGVTAGFIIALVTSGVVGISAESFWRPFFVALGFSLVCVGAATWLLVVAERTRLPRRR